VVPLLLVSSLAYSSTLKMEATRPLTFNVLHGVISQVTEFFLKSYRRGTLRRVSPFFRHFFFTERIPINHWTARWVVPKTDLNTVVATDGKIIPAFMILLSNFTDVSSIYCPKYTYTWFNLK
jgi:hypothetical protein